MRLRAAALAAVLFGLAVALFQACGGRIEAIPSDAGVDGTAAAPPLPDATIDAADGGTDAADADAYDAYDGADVWDGYYDPYAVQPDPYDAAAFPPCLDTNKDADPGAPSDVYPALHPAMPIVAPAGGPTMTTPTIAVITFPGDPLADDIERFVTTLGSSAYWQGFAPAYGIAAPKMVSVRLQDPPLGRYTDGLIEDYLTRQLDGTHPEFPPPSDQILYAVFLPDGVSVAPPPPPGEPYAYGCSDYHYRTVIAGRPVVSYAVVPRCADGVSSLSGIDLATLRASRALVAGMTNPAPQTPGRMLDQDHFMFGFLNGQEPPDLCSLTTKPLPHEGIPVPPSADLPFWVQRQWSNDASSAWHQACAPHDPSDGPFFAAVPVLKDQVMTRYPPPRQDDETTTLGVDIPLKLCRVIEVDLISDAPTSSPIQLHAFESGQLYEPCPKDPLIHCNPKISLQFAWDKTEGYNGEKRYLTVAVNGINGPSGYDAFFIQATVDGVSKRWPVVIGNAFPP